VWSLFITKLNRRGNKTSPWGKPLLILIVTCSIPSLYLTIQHSSILIHSTVSGSISLLSAVALIELKMVLSNASLTSMTAVIATYLYLNAFSIQRQDRAMHIRSTFLPGKHTASGAVFMPRIQIYQLSIVFRRHDSRSLFPTLGI
jgi:hypothetical protein